MLTRAIFAVSEPEPATTSFIRHCGPGENRNLALPTLTGNPNNVEAARFEIGALALETVYLQEGGAQERGQKHAKYCRQDYPTLLLPAFAQSFLDRLAVTFLLFAPCLFLGGAARLLLRHQTCLFFRFAPGTLSGFAGGLSCCAADLVAFRPPGT